MNNITTVIPDITIGVDVSDKYSYICAIDSMGEMIEESKIPTKPDAFRHKFTCNPTRIVIEAGTHSLWIDKTLRELGHEVIVANPRKLNMIFQNNDKDDKVDARILARMGRYDPGLLSPIEHRKGEEQEHLEFIKARDLLVRFRTALVNHIRGAAKTLGYKVLKCSTECFDKKAAAQLPESLLMSVSPLLEMIGELTRKIRDFDKQIEALCEKTYPATSALRQVNGVGPLTALAYVLSIGDPYRFKNSRVLGSYIGLRPRRDDSGERKSQLHITKAGNNYLRGLLISSAQYILGPFGKDSNLRRWGLGKSLGGGKIAKNRAVVGVARKLAVLLHRLWITGETYEPLRNAEIIIVE